MRREFNGFFIIKQIGKPYIYIYIFLTYRFQVAVRLFSNRSQMTSKCGKNKKVAHEAQTSSVIYCGI